MVYLFKITETTRVLISLVKVPKSMQQKIITRVLYCILYTLLYTLLKTMFRLLNNKIIELQKHICFKISGLGTQKYAVKTNPSSYYQKCL